VQVFACVVYRWRMLPTHAWRQLAGWQCRQQLGQADPLARGVPQTGSCKWPLLLFSMRRCGKRRAARC